jgi:C4-dicarboxylate-binding protein DctP
MKTNVLGLAAALVVIAGGPAAADCQSGEQVIRFSHVEAASGNPKGEAAAALAARVNEELDGRACMEVTANATDHDESTMLAGLQHGAFDMAAGETGLLGAVSPRFLVFDLPFLFDDIEAVLAFQASDTGADLLEATRSAGIVGLGFWLDGFEQMTADRAIAAPGDLEGLSVWVRDSELKRAYIETIGAEPVTMPLTEVADALAEGEIDAQGSSWSTIATQGFAAAQEGFTETNHSVILYMVMTSASFWDGLDPALREDLARIVKEVSHERNRLAFQLNQAARFRMQQNGVRVRELDEAQRAAWKRALQEVWFGYGGDIGFDQISTALHVNRRN